MARTPLHVAGAEVVAAYRAAGLRATLDRADINPPCAYVVFDSVTGYSLDAETYTATWLVLLVAPSLAQSAALKVQGPLLEAALSVFPTLSEPVDVVAVAPLEGGDPMPALALTITTRVTPE
jgi:hypothetical protein